VAESVITILKDRQTDRQKDNSCYWQICRRIASFIRYCRAIAAAAAAAAYKSAKFSWAAARRAERDWHDERIEKQKYKL